MTYFIIVGLVIIWIALCNQIGIIEADNYFIEKNSSIIGRDEHPVFTVERFLMWIPFEIALHVGDNITWLNGLCLPFLFVMIHDGAYYVRRNKLDNSYPKGFWDFSTTSTAWMDRKRLTTVPLRIAYFAIGILGLILINI